MLRSRFLSCCSIATLCHFPRSMDNIRFYSGPGRELSTLPQPVCSFQTMALAVTKENPGMPQDSADPPSLAPFETHDVSHESAQDSSTYPEASLLRCTPPSAESIDIPRRPERVEHLEIASAPSTTCPLNQARAVRPLVSPWLVCSIYTESGTGAS